MTYQDFITQHFGYTYLKGFKYLVRACELFESLEISEIYHVLAVEFNTNYKAIEKNIRTYKDKIQDKSMILTKLDNKFTNYVLISAIYYTVNMLNKED